MKVKRQVTYELEEHEQALLDELKETSDRIEVLEAEELKLLRECKDAGMPSRLIADYCRHEQSTISRKVKPSEQDEGE